MDNHKAVYHIIKKCFKPFFVQEPKDLEDLTLNVYLTVYGVRPACFPSFGNDWQRDVLESGMLEIWQRAIPNIVIKVGPYGDSAGGIEIVFVNKQQYSRLHKYFKELDVAAPKDGEELPKHSGIAIGKILGYTCPSDLAELYKHASDLEREGKRGVVYNISYSVKNNLVRNSKRLDIVGYWCIQTNLQQAVAVLTKMNDALAPLHMSATLEVKEEYP